MLKNTIKKVFQKDFIENIWKIEVNGYRDEIGVEIRDSQTTLPTYHILRFEDGMDLMRYSPEEKDWTMEGLQKDFLILKKVGEQTPTKEGIQVVNIRTETPVFTSYEYTLLDVCEDYLHVRHRSFTSGGEQLIALTTGEVFPVSDVVLQRYPKNRVSFPLAYDKHRPAFLPDHPVCQDLWISKLSEAYLWCYHTQQNNGYDLHIAVSDLEQVHDQVVVQSAIPKMFPQPYFQVGNHLFFMADNKHEIVSYLV
ncbi:hypothetical protein M8998_14260 [Sphingobacterium sp. lm-10]|uniref:hypothetical protein n=1 Tax=Sphingobacterium sp. lm-10 TaxID=2944904 RepID=UPI0020213902|nr:hypothetical protein [Sphingobacterium sp. lm-10]MCL7989108.1 hypothetical protein [Sphingobacterium sp. lm-10]